MPTFKNMADVKKYIEKHAGTIKLANGKTVGQLLADESRRLKGIITKHIALYYNSYDPRHYERTFGLINSLRIDMRQNGNELTAKVYFDEDTATHPSVVKGGEPGFTPILIDQGWKDRGHQEPHFKGFRGTGFIKAAVDEYNESNPYGFKIRVEYMPYDDLNFEAGG